MVTMPFAALLEYDKDADRDRNYMFYVVSQATQVVQSSNSSSSVRQFKWFCKTIQVVQ